MELLGPGLLEGRAIVVAGNVSETVAGLLDELGARIERLGEFAEADEAVGDWARARAPLNALVYDSGAAFGGGGSDALLGMMQKAWAAVREVAVGALIDGAGPAKVLLLAPRPAAGPGASAASASLENLARTLSVEWARHGVTAVMVAPGASSSEAELSQLICFLCSPAGDYFSGCRIELEGSAGSR
jgi:NAD(P)-dependent dehydrogenase (short-subunit alcohol dehydrogenase family)